MVDLTGREKMLMLFERMMTRRPVWVDSGLGQKVRITMIGVDDGRWVAYDHEGNVRLIADYLLDNPGRSESAGGISSYGGCPGQAGASGSKWAMRSRYCSIASYVDALQWTGENWAELSDFLGGSHLFSSATRGLLLIHAGKNGEQGWVPVPVGNWIVHRPDDLTDIWPVAPDHFAKSYYQENAE